MRITLAVLLLSSLAGCRVGTARVKQAGPDGTDILIHHLVHRISELNGRLTERKRRLSSMTTNASRNRLRCSSNSIDITSTAVTITGIAVVTVDSAGLHASTGRSQCTLTESSLTLNGVSRTAALDAAGSLSFNGTQVVTIQQANIRRADRWRSHRYAGEIGYQLDAQPAANPRTDGLSGQAGPVPHERTKAHETQHDISLPARALVYADVPAAGATNRAARWPDDTH